MKSGFIGIIGRPNVGKSTLINKLIKEKVSIVSPRAQTTRDSIKGIVNRGDVQFVFIDTPGIHKPKNLLGEFMNSAALNVKKEIDVLMLILDGTQKIGVGDKFVFEKLKNVTIPIVVVLNKIDLMSDADIEKYKFELEQNLKFNKLKLVASKFGIGTEELLEEIKNYLPDHDFFYPEDMYTDFPMYKVITEMVREKILFHLRDEIPHGVAVVIENVVKREKKKSKYDIIIYVERSSQKGIVIGKNGKMLKKIGSESRIDIEEVLQKEIYLNLWVKVKEKWRKNKDFLKELGYVK